jgi:putative membrane protein
MLMRFALSCLLYALSVMLAAKVVPGLRVKSYGGAVVFAVVFGILDGLLFKVLAILTAPLILVTLGLFILVIRGFIFWLADQLVDSVETSGFGAALLGSLVSGAINYGIHFVLRLR